MARLRPTSARFRPKLSQLDQQVWRSRQILGRVRPGFGWPKVGLVSTKLGPFRPHIRRGSSKIEAAFDTQLKRTWGGGATETRVRRVQLHAFRKGYDARSGGLLQGGEWARNTLRTPAHFTRRRRMSAGGAPLRTLDGRGDSDLDGRSVSAGARSGAGVKNRTMASPPGAAGTQDGRRRREVGQAAVERSGGRLGRSGGLVGRSGRRERAIVVGRILDGSGVLIVPIRFVPACPKRWGLNQSGPKPYHFRGIWLLDQTWCGLDQIRAASTKCSTRFDRVF